MQNDDASEPPTLPEELIEHILLFLDNSPATLVRVKRVSRAFNRISTSVLAKVAIKTKSLLMTAIVFDHNPNQLAQRALWGVDEVSDLEATTTLARFIPLYSCFIKVSTVSCIGPLLSSKIVSSGTELSHRPTGISIRLVDDGRLLVSCVGTWTLVYDSVRWQTEQTDPVKYQVEMKLSDWAAHERERFAGIPNDSAVTVRGTVQKDLETGETVVKTEEMLIPVEILVRKIVLEDLARERNQQGHSSFVDAVRVWKDKQVAVVGA